MAEFLLELFQSIFTPGPTPTLLLATNVTFAALQVLLLLLLVSTKSIHFFILSILSAGLWSAINWFVNELKIVKLAEMEKEAPQSEDQCLSEAKKYSSGASYQEDNKNHDCRVILLRGNEPGKKEE